MKIGIICYPTYGGSGVVATELGKALAKNGHQIHFISYRQPARLETFSDNIFYHEVSIADYPLFEYPPYESALASTIVDVINYEGLDLLHAHYAIPHAASAYMAKKISTKNIPIITTLHGTDITLVGKNKMYAPVVEFSINESDGITSVSESLKKDTLDYFNIKKEIKVIPNFIDLERFKRNENDGLKKSIAPNGEPVLIHVSNFRKVKRIQDIIKMFKEVLDTMPCKLLLVGDGPERSNMEQLCRELNTCDNIKFMGKQEAIENLLSVSDIFVLPSETESFGLSALEAMACRVPVISSNTGGIPEININGQTGFTSDVGNYKAMAQNTIKLLGNKELYQSFSNNAYGQALRFDLKKIMPLYEKYYEEIIKSAS